MQKLFVVIAAVFVVLVASEPVSFFFPARTNDDPHKMDVDDVLDSTLDFLELSGYQKNRTLPEPLEPTKAAGIASKDVLGRHCMNECGGYCRQLCAKFKALKVFED